VDEAERIRAFGRDLDDRLAERTVATDVGDALFVDTLPNVYMLNYLRADRGDSRAIAAAAEHALEAFHHRKVFTYLDVDLGWQRNTHLVMLHRREPDRRVDTSHVRTVSFEEIAPVRAYDYDDDALGEQLNEAQRRVNRAIDAEWLAAFDGGELAAWCHIRSRGGIAQIEDVNTVPHLRRRGHGRAVVQHALDKARAAHELVYLEALEEDWPRHLYARLGFAEIDRCHHHVRPGHPAPRLRIRTPRLELRLATVAELRELYRVAEAGVHHPAVMPMSTPWTDSLDEGDFLAFHRDALARSTREKWQLNLIAFHDGRPIGSQGIESDGPGRVVTGSWLGQAYQGRGYGAEMRSAILSFAFDVLGAETALSSAWVDNPASRAVSRKLGYREVGSHFVSPRGEPLEHLDLELRRTEFEPLVPVDIAGFDPSWLTAK
jgi:RimJ/RimL family protein N-acetyltransferase/N-acetylglutamate synthase-like GNAT family acetyltransferase